MTISLAVVTLRMAVRVRFVVALALASFAVLASAEAPAAGSTSRPAPTAAEWNFRVLLDGKPIGHHRFSITSQGDERKVLSEANFAVKFLGITAYRYKHHASEHWRGGCLVALKSTTDDDGKRSEVSIDRTVDSSMLKVAAAEASVSTDAPQCLMSFAYWNPAIQTQRQLLNAQTGKLEDVNVIRVGDGSVDANGTSIGATRFRITGAAQAIDVWYSARGEWLGLDSTVAGGRVLSYRLEP